MEKRAEYEIIIRVSKTGEYLGFLAVPENWTLSEAQAYAERKNADPANLKAGISYIVNVKNWRP